MVILAASIFTLTTNRAVQAKTPVPADLFMQSVVKRDGALGWHQLCPAVQAQMPLSMLVSQVRKQRIAESGKGLRLTVEYIGARARTQDGQIRVYVVSARRADGWSGQRTFIVTTQASGCVEDVTNSWRRAVHMNIITIVLLMVLGYEEYLLWSFSEWTETSFSHRLFNSKDMLKISTVAEKQGEIAVPTEKNMTDDLERLASNGFTSEEVDSLIWLQKWYQTGGSDRIELVRNWEFCRFLVIKGKLDV
jgi:hypothetical protein